MTHNFPIQCEYLFYDNRKKNIVGINFIIFVLFKIDSRYNIVVSYSLEDLRSINNHKHVMFLRFA